MSFVTRNWFWFCIVLGVCITVLNIAFGPSLFLQVCYLATLILAPAFIRSKFLVAMCIACALLSAAVHTNMLFNPRIITVTVTAKPTVICQECTE